MSNPQSPQTHEPPSGGQNTPASGTQSNLPPGTQNPSPAPPGSQRNEPPHWEGAPPPWGWNGPPPPGGWNRPWAGPPQRDVAVARADFGPFSYDSYTAIPVFNYQFGGWGFWYMGVWIPLY